MVRTRADAGATKVSAAKAPRKVLSNPSGAGMSSSSTGGKASSKDRYSGGNSYNPQPTPEWQKGINTFFKMAPKPQEGESSTNSGNSSNSTPVKSESSPSKEGTSSNFAKNGMVSDDED
nr:PCNA-associated factor-like [Procambarus clarkii]XP_045595362.1 PCNA-associated factor-like [Procambarus clarkii]XP_045595363.1 PCNA-associated factor-like [Procambarus clarkii]